VGRILCMAPAHPAINFSERRHIALKLFIDSKSIETEQDNELNIYKRIKSSSKNHPGCSAVRSLLDSFDVNGPNERHLCLVHPPLWESVLDFKHRNPCAEVTRTGYGLCAQALLSGFGLPAQ
jgi:hypothetical protein